MAWPPATHADVTARIDGISPTGVVAAFPYKSAAWYGRPVITGFSAQALVLDQVNTCLHEVRSSSPLSVQKTQMNISAAGGVGSVLRMGWYRVGPNGYPGDLIVDLGTVASTTVGNVTIAAAYELPLGAVWFAVVPQLGTAPGVRVDGAYRSTPFVSNDQVDPADQSAAESSPYISGVAGALPASFGPIAGISNLTPTFYYQLA